MIFRTVADFTEN